VLIVIGFILNIIGIIGVILPALPGVVLNYSALILLYISKGQAGINIDLLIVFGLLTVLVSSLDYILPLLGAKKYGASRMGIYGSALGMIIGILFFPPFGIIFGLLIGAFLGELIAGKNQSQALKEPDFNSGKITACHNYGCLFYSSFNLMNNKEVK